ncbi:hypothetical protein SALB1_3123 [Salinisphaera sp. LB1]|nr:hypothetical protein SALB1_3123 [Salinisphaera sp. LB1]
MVAAGQADFELSGPVADAKGSQRAHSRGVRGVVADTPRGMGCV